MKNITYILFSLVCLYSCSEKNKIIKPVEAIDFDVVFLNDTVQIPLYDSIRSVDTIYTLLKNNSKFEYVFLLSDTCIFFDSDPSQGLIAAFMDDNNVYLKTELVSGFTEDIYFEGDKDLKYIKPNSSYLIKTPLKFPHYIKNIHMSVPELYKARKVRIIFDSYGFTSYFDQKYKNGLKGNQRILGVKQDKIIPVRFKN